MKGFRGKEEEKKKSEMTFGWEKKTVVVCRLCASSTQGRRVRTELEMNRTAKFMMTNSSNSSIQQKFMIALAAVAETRTWRARETHYKHIIYYYLWLLISGWTRTDYKTLLIIILFAILSPQTLSLSFSLSLSLFRPPSIIPPLSLSTLPTSLHHAHSHCLYLFLTMTIRSFRGIVFTIASTRYYVQYSFIIT